MIYLAKYAEAAVLDGHKLKAAGSANFKSNPTLAAGDVQISKDGGASANLATLPSVLPAAGTDVRVELGAVELTCRVASITFIDAAGAEWDNYSFQVFTYGHPSAFLPFDFGNAAVALTSPQVDELVDRIWDAQRSDHTVLGSFGEGVNLSATERANLTNALLDQADTIETGLALRGALRLIAASAAGTSSGAGTDTFVLNNAVAGNKPRITATVSNEGNRLAIIYDLT